mgnify:CR=1 FL=1
MKKIFVFMGLFASTCAFAIDVIGHRGEPRLAPENTAESFNFAYRIGAKWAECDMHYTKAGEIVVMHADAELKSVWGIKKTVADITPADREKSRVKKSEFRNFNSKIPTALDVLKCVPKGCFMECEIKSYSPEFAEAFDKARKQAGLDESQVIIISFNENALADFKSKFPKYRTRYLTSSFDKGKNLIPAEMIIEKAKKSGAEQVSMGNYMKLEKSHIDKIKSAGFRVGFWCVDTEEQLAKAVECGVDAVTSNRTDYLKKNLKTFKSVEGAVLE